MITTKGKLNLEVFKVKEGITRFIQKLCVTTVYRTTFQLGIDTDQLTPFICELYHECRLVSNKVNDKPQIPYSHTPNGIRSYRAHAKGK